MDLPAGIQEKLEGQNFQIDEVGLSDSKVYLFDDQVLKIGEANEESENEYRMMRWLAGKLPLPRPVAYECGNGKSYLLMTRITGKMACDDAYMKNPELLTEMLAEALKRLWAVDISECPCVWQLERKLAMAKYRVEHDMVGTEDAEPDTYGPGGFASPHELLQWLITHKPQENPVLSHGDFCLPNIFFEDGSLKGYIDLGRMGAADQWQDIALCYRSLKHNYDGMYGGKKYEGYEPEMFFDKLGIRPDWEKIRYYILLDELF